MRIVVTGGRDFKDFYCIDRELCRYFFAPNKITELAHGDARGADRIAGEWAEMRNVPVTKFPAGWNKYGRVAGHRRNIEMLDTFKPDLVIAFPGGKGTAHCVSEALKRGISVREVICNFRTP